MPPRPPGRRRRRPSKKIVARLDAGLAQQAAFREAIEQIPLLGHPHAPPEALAPDVPWLFTVTFLAGSEITGGTRTVAICSTWEKACSFILEDGPSFHEQTYHLAVVETCRPDAGYGGFDRQSWWFRWVPTPGDVTGDGGSFYPCECPSAYRCVQGWGIG